MKLLKSRSETKVFIAIFIALLTDSAHSVDRVTVLNCLVTASQVVMGQETRETAEARIEIREEEKREISISIKSASRMINNITAESYNGGLNTSSENKWEVTDTFDVNSEKMRTSILIDRITGKLLVNWSMPKNRITVAGDCSKVDPTKKKF